MRIPIATYRVQFNKDFRFADATALVPPLNRLGISHLYASPIFAARAGSMHGYDVIDPNRLNPELGSQEDFDTLARALKDHGMGLLLDIVPNHMAASPENRWWMDVLENGPSSPYASYFGIDWTSAKIFLPILGGPYGKVLENGEIRLAYGQAGFFLQYYAHELPITPASYARILAPGLPDNPEFSLLLESFQRLPGPRVANWDADQDKHDLKDRLWQLAGSDAQVRGYIHRRLQEWNAGQPDDLDRLDELIEEQAYRIAFWKVATERMSYRRFFDVSELIGVRAEDPAVFDAGHKLILELVRTGKVDGLRIDHIDGLAEPLSYQQRLAGEKVYVLAEKILAEGEELPDEWPIQGTSGYDFLGMVSSSFVEPAGFAMLHAYYEKLTGSEEPFADVAYRRKGLIISTLFSGELQDLGASLASLAEKDRNARDLSLRDLTQAIVEVTASMPVYRTYTASLAVSERDARYVLQACEAARERNSSIDPLVYDFVERVLTLRFKRWMTEEDQRAWLRFVMQWQQISGPIMAKGVEDSTMYVYNALISMNDVGGIEEPVSAEALHAFFARRRDRWPHTMNATSTHDTKRSEDVRARISVLPEMASEWTRNTARWSKWLTEQRGSIDLNEEYFLFQTLLGAWPLNAEETEEFRDRMKAYIVKAAREARTHTSWLQPDEAHEKALQTYVDALFNNERFQASFQTLLERVSFYGAIQSLSQLLLKVTAPGVPDFYRGTVRWDFSLVDPDNRRPVEFAPLTDFGWNPRELMETWRDGRVKVFLTEKLLGYRKGNPELFSEGSYIPLQVSGKRAENVFAYARRLNSQWCIAVIPRFASQLSVTTRTPTGIRAWLDSTLALPEGAPRRWKNIITGQTILVRDGGLPLYRVMEHFPMALLSAK